MIIIKNKKLSKNRWDIVLNNIRQKKIILRRCTFIKIKWQIEYSCSDAKV